MISSTSENPHAGEVLSCSANELREPSSDSRQWTVWAGLAAVFVVAFGLRVWFNFFCDHYNATWSCDAAEYLRNAQALQKLLSVSPQVWGQAVQSLIGAAGPQEVEQVRLAFGFLHEMHQSAPVFPLFIAVACELAGMPIAVSSWSAPIMGQCLLSSLTCMLIALIGFQAWDRKTGYLAGVVAAFYPGFIVNSGRLYSETFAVFLLTVVAWITLRGLSAKGNSTRAVFINGCFAAALQMTRSVMSLVSVLLLVVTFAQARREKRWGHAAALVAGLAAITVPWMALQGIVFGKSTVIVDRVGHYNFCTGNNVDSGGWLSYPYADSSAVETKSYLQMGAESVKRSPTRWLRLMADKPVRLFKFPWNDFRVSIGPIEFQGQVLLHQLLLLSAALGLVLAFLTGGGAPSTRQISCRLLLVAMVVPSLAYLMFITVPRYNLTAMPIVILFGAAGVTALWRLVLSSLARPGGYGSRPYGIRLAVHLPRFGVCMALIVSCALLFAAARTNLVPLILGLPGCGSITPTQALCLAGALKGIALVSLIAALWVAVGALAGNRKAARFAAVLLGAAMLPALCLPIRAHGRWWEWHTSLAASNLPIEQKIRIPQQTTPQILGSDWYLMVDSSAADQVAQGMKISVNGHGVDGPVLPSLALVPDMAGIKEHAPGKAYRECEYIFDCLTRPAGIGNSAIRQWFFVPLPAAVLVSASGDHDAVVRITATGEGETTLFGSYPMEREAWIPALSLYSWEKAFYGVENDAGLTDTRYDIKLPEHVANVVTREDRLPAKSERLGSYNLRLLAIPTTDTASGDPFKVLTTVRDEHVVILSAGLPRRSLLSQIPENSDAGLLVVRITGEVMRTSDRVRAGVEVVAQFATNNNSKAVSYQSPWACRDLRSDKQWKAFKLSVPILADAFPGKPQSVDVQLYATGADGQNRRASDINQDSAGFRNVTVEILGLRGNPLARNGSIY